MAACESPDLALVQAGVQSSEDIQIDQSYAMVGFAANNVSALRPAPSDQRTRPRTSKPSQAQLNNQIYKLPAPVFTYPLPFFSPSNPFSMLQVVYTWVQQLISPPSSHPSTLYRGWYSPETQTVHVTDQKSIRDLWERGFYGKGTLSRSEPSWLAREKRRRGERANQTSEEVTRRRRAERQRAKWERARLEREAIEETLLREQGFDPVRSDKSEDIGRSPAFDAPVGPAELLALPNSAREVEQKSSREQVASLTEDEGYASARVSVMSDEATKDMPTAREISQAASAVETDSLDGRPDPKRPDSAKSVRFSPTIEQKTFIPDQPASPTHAAVDDEIGQTPEPVIEDKEHLQLTLEEALFLNFGFGVLEVLDPFTKMPIPTRDLLAIGRLSSEFGATTHTPMPDDNFMLSYVVYHHFRSLGWTVRGGIKFGVDYLLYMRGPPFSHAEFAVSILPAYSHPYWSQDAERRAHVAAKTSHNWSWLHCINRVNTQVKKTLVLVYVEVPPPTSGVLGEEVPITQLLASYKVREIVLKRWSANRSRD